MTHTTLRAAEGEGGGGFHPPGLEIFEWEPMFTAGPLDFTKPLLLVVVAAVAVIGFFGYAFRRPQLVPRGAQNVGEVAYLFVRDQIARQVIGKEGDRYVPLLFSLFFFIWATNLMGVIPLIHFPATAVIGVPAALAVIVYFVWVPLGMKRQGGLGFFRNTMFPPGLPKPIYLILAPIELISNFLVRPFTHAVRLFANMFAGHLTLAVFSVAAWHFLVEDLGALAPVGVLSFVMLVLMLMLELLIQALQAYIFTLLTALYIGGALHAEH